MKGHMQDGKFHPHTQSKGVRKSRDQTAKTQGVKIRKARKTKTILKSKLPPDVYFSEHNWGFETDSNGNVSKVRLGNWSDAGWHWDGDEEDLVGFIIRMGRSQIEDEFIEKMEAEGVGFMTMKPLLLKKLDGSWLYEISGDNTRWHFHQDVDEGAMVSEELEYGGDTYTDKEQEMIGEELWNISTSYEFEEFEENWGEQIKKEMKEIIEGSTTYNQFFSKINDEDFRYNMDERYIEGVREKIQEAIIEAISKLEKEGKIRKEGQERLDQ